MSRLKIKKLFNYLKKKDARLNFLTQGKGYGSREFTEFSYDEPANEFTYHAWDEHPHAGSPLNEITHKIPVDEKTVVKLTKAAMVFAEKDYDAFVEKKEREKKLKAVRSYMDAKLYGKGISFILNDD